MDKNNNRDAWIDAGMQLIPYVGPSLSALFCENHKALLMGHRL